MSLDDLRCASRSLDNCNADGFTCPDPACDRPRPNPDAPTVADVRESVTWLRSAYLEHDDLRWLLSSLDNVLTLAEFAGGESQRQILRCFAPWSSLNPYHPEETP